MTSSSTSLNDLMNIGPAETFNRGYRISDAAGRDQLYSIESSASQTETARDKFSDVLQRQSEKAQNRDRDRDRDTEDSAPTDRTKTEPDQAENPAATSEQARTEKVDNSTPKDDKQQNNAKEQENGTEDKTGEKVNEKPGSKSGDENTNNTLREGVEKTAVNTANPGAAAAGAEKQTAKASAGQTKEDAPKTAKAVITEVSVKQQSEHTTAKAANNENTKQTQAAQNSAKAESASQTPQARTENVSTVSAKQAGGNEVTAAEVKVQAKSADTAVLDNQPVKETAGVQTDELLKQVKSEVAKQTAPEQTNKTGASDKQTENITKDKDQAFFHSEKIKEALEKNIQDQSVEKGQAAKQAVVEAAQPDSGKNSQSNTAQGSSANFAKVSQPAAVSQTQNTFRSAGPEAVNGTPIEQVMASIRSATLGPEQRLTIRLNPAELGAVMVRFERDTTGQITGLVQTERPEVRREIEKAVPELVSSLQQSGVNVRRVTVSEQPGSSNQQNARHNDSQDVDAEDHRQLFEETGREYSGTGSKNQRSPGKGQNSGINMDNSGQKYTEKMQDNTYYNQRGINIFV